MRKALLTALAAVLFVAGLTAATGFAGVGKHHHRPPLCVPRRGHYCPGHPGTTTIPTTTTVPTTTMPPTTTSPPPTTTTPPPTTTSPTPPVNLSMPTEDYCVQTVQRGNTYVQAAPGSFAPGGDWYALWTSGATVVVAGQTVTLEYENGNGLILAAHVPNQWGNPDAGYTSTCDQPAVSSTMHYAQPAYGLRGAAWAAAVIAGPVSTVATK